MLEKTGNLTQMFYLFSVKILLSIVPVIGENSKVMSLKYLMNSDWNFTSISQILLL